MIIVSHLGNGLTFKTEDGKEHTINGVNDVLRGQEMGVLIVGGGVTTTLSDEVGEYFFKAYKDFEAIKNGLIYSAKTKKDALAEIKEKKELRHGKEPIDTTDPKQTRTTKAK